MLYYLFNLLQFFSTERSGIQCFQVLLRLYKIHQFPHCHSFQDFLGGQLSVNDTVTAVSSGVCLVCNFYSFQSYFHRLVTDAVYSYRLAMLLSGTMGAIRQFIPSVEDGLASRMLFVELPFALPWIDELTDAEDYMSENPDIIAFDDLMVCTTDVKTYEKELKRKDSNGNEVSYNPPRFETAYDFYINMHIANNPYFDDIRFKLNGSTVTLETRAGSSVGFLGMTFNTASVNVSSQRDQQRYQDYTGMCQQIEFIVQKSRQTAPVAAPAAEPAAAPIAPVAEPAAPAGPKFCPNCGAAADGGKFCQYCGAKF